jgi:amino-acid N-acetyltransferase
MNEILSSQVDLIREVFHYQNRFEGSIMVFKIDYPVTEDPGFQGLVKDLALLSKTGFKVIIVPGVKENIDEVFKQHDIESSFAQTNSSSSSLMHGYPVRVTTQQAIPFVEMAAFDVASKFMTFLTGSKIEAVIGNFVRARGLGILNGIDTEHTGTVDKIYADSLMRVLNLGIVPILPCIGWSPSGKPYNVPSNEIALAVSSALGAVKLFILSAHEGLHVDNSLHHGNTSVLHKHTSLFKRLLHIADPEEAHALTDAKALSPTSSSVPENELCPQNAPLAKALSLETRPDGSIIRLTIQQAESLIAFYEKVPKTILPKGSDINLQELNLALRANRAGIPRVHIIDGREEGAVLKELFSNLGVGTMVYIDEYDSIRAFRSRDMPDILRLMEPLMQKDILIRRNSEQILEKKNDYAVLEIDGSIRACGALHDWGEAQAEIAAIATDPQYTDLGLSRKIVGFFIEKDRKNQLKRVFVLTTQTQDWFEGLGFKEAAVNTLPEQKRKLYNHARKSKVFALEL